MGNSISSNGFGNNSSNVCPTIPAIEVLRLVAQEEKVSGKPARLVSDGRPAPEESELPGALLALGVDMGDASVQGEVVLSVGLL